MAETGWLRFFGANRARQHGLKTRASEAALHDILKTSPGNKEVHTQHKREKMTRLPSWQGISDADRGTASFPADSALDQADKEFISASQEVWQSPSVDQLAESLRSAWMTTPANEPLSAEYRPHVLLLCEFYGTRYSKIAKLESQLAEAKEELDKETERHKSIEEHWMVQEARYKAEVKRLEMFIHNTSDKGMEAVVLARAGSLIRSKLKETAMGRTSEETNLATTCHNTTVSNVTPQNVHAEAALNSALPTRQGTVYTTNEVRLSNVFRKLEKTKNTTNGARRNEFQDVDRGKAHLKSDRASQRSQSDSMSRIGPSMRGTVVKPPRRGSPEMKRGSTEKTAALEEVGVVGQPTCAATTSAHEDGKAMQDRVQNKPPQSTRQGYTRHNRQFSFVPGDDTTAVQLTDAKTPGDAPISQNENIPASKVWSGLASEQLRFSIISTAKVYEGSQTAALVKSGEDWGQPVSVKSVKPVSLDKSAGAEP
ncbi:hypothetical protein FLONG3_6587 [Fusarium longipes]|uniref:Uncharacterized protein n=1 Tax=Fusarium longipes TaxID=694270 RepID=A0A395SK98_9HYPO|nr:hypothetical protein FLONG3_6587 [Fusarium longipes]